MGFLPYLFLGERAPLFSIPLTCTLVMEKAVAIVTSNVLVSGCFPIVRFNVNGICPVVSNSSSATLGVVVFYFFQQFLFDFTVDSKCHHVLLVALQERILRSVWTEVDRT